MTAGPTLADRGRTIVAVATRSEVALLAAAIAFYALLSIIPLAVVVVALAATVGGEALIDQGLASIDHLVTTSTADFIRSGLEADIGRSGATISGFLVAGWGSLKVFRALDRAFDAIYDARSRATLLATIRNGLAVLVGILGIAAAIAIAFGGLYLLELSLPGALIPLAVTPGLVVVLVPLYMVFPPTRPSVTTALPGAVVGASGITLSTLGLQLYITLVAPFAIYGVLAGSFVIMTWLYLLSGSLLLGAVVNATGGGRHRQVHFPAPPQPGPDGPMVEDDAEPAEELSAEEIAAMRSRLEALEGEVEDRTVHRDEIEGELRRYVRKRQRRGHARGWGPYLVLLYGVVMTLGGFYYLEGWVAVAAMIVIWLSTLGLYVFMVVLGTSVGVLATLKGLIDRLRGS